MLLPLPARAEAFFAGATYRTEAEAPAVADAGEIAFISNADLAPRGSETGVPARLRSPGNADRSDEVFLFRPGALWPFVQLTDDAPGSRKSHVALGRDGRAALWAEGPLPVETRGTEEGTITRIFLLPLGRRQPLLLAESRGVLGGTTVSDRLPFGYRAAFTVIGAEGARVRVVDALFNETPRVLRRAEFAGRDPSLSRDGARLAYTAPDDAGRSQVRLRVLNGEDRAITAGEADSARPRISGDGRRIAFESRANLAVFNGDGNREIFLHDTGTGRTLQITRTGGSGPSAPDVENRSPRVNGDGTRVAFLSNGNLVGRNADGSEEVFLWIDGNPPRMRQMTDTQPEYPSEPGVAPYPIASRPRPAGAS